MDRAGRVGTKLIQGARGCHRNEDPELAQQAHVLGDSDDAAVDSIGCAARGLRRKRHRIAHLDLEPFHLRLEDQHGVGLGQILQPSTGQLDDLAKAGLVLDVDTGDAGLGRARVRDDLGPAAAAMNQALHLGHALSDRFDDLLIIGHDRAAEAAGHLEETAHVDMAGTQRGRSSDHGFTHTARQGIEQDEQSCHARDGRGQKEGAPAVLKQAAKGDTKIEKESHD